MSEFEDNFSRNDKEWEDEIPLFMLKIMDCLDKGLGIESSNESSDEKSGDDSQALALVAVDEIMEGEWKRERTPANIMNSAPASGGYWYQPWTKFDQDIIFPR